MIESSLEEQQPDRSTKPVQALNSIATELSMDKLVEPTTLVDIHIAIRETFGDWA